MDQTKDNGTTQRSYEWHQNRLGKFSASEIYKLMGIKGLGETGKTYCLQKAIEEFTGQKEETFVSYAMEIGIYREPLAFSKFKEIKSLDFIEVTECGSFEYKENCIASPDGLVGDDAVLEIKCGSYETFFNVVANNYVNDKYFYQMQMQMICTGRERAYFFNYIIIEGLEYWHTIIVERDQAICDKIIERIAEAIEIKNEYITKINNNKQF